MFSTIVLLLLLLIQMEHDLPFSLMYYIVLTEYCFVRFHMQCSVVCTILFLLQCNKKIINWIQGFYYPKLFRIVQLLWLCKVCVCSHFFTNIWSHTGTYILSYHSKPLLTCLKFKIVYMEQQLHSMMIN